MTAPATESPADAAPSPRRRRPLRRLLIFLTVAYVLVSLLLFFAQDVMIFPGSLMKVSPITAAPDQELVRLPIPGGDVVALFSAHPGADPASRPTVIYFYGNGEAMRFARTEMKLFRQMGYNVLIPDYPGYGMSAGRPSAQNVYQTADACYDYVTRQRGVPPERIAVVGRSIGGAPAVYLASKHPVGALATVSAFRSLAEIASRTVYYLFPVSLLVRHDFDNLSRMKDVRCPVLLVHGTADELIPFDSAAALAKATTAPITVYSVQSGMHNDIYDVGGADLAEAIEAFLRRALQPTPATAPAQ